MALLRNKQKKRRFGAAWAVAVAFVLAALAHGRGYASGDEAPLLEEGAHCVAYRAERVLFFVSKAAVVGRNCDVSAQVLPELGGLYHIEVNVPLQSFSSGDKERDKDVMRVLKAEERPELTFRTKALTAESWKALFATKDFDVEGELAIGSKSFPLKLRAHYREKPGMAEVGGLASVRFADFDLKPPAILGGLVGKAKPDLELHFRLISQRILGADSVRLGKSDSVDGVDPARESGGPEKSQTPRKANKGPEKREKEKETL